MMRSLGVASARDELENWREQSRQQTSTPKRRKEPAAAPAAVTYRTRSRGGGGGGAADAACEAPQHEEDAPPLPPPLPPVLVDSALARFATSRRRRRVAPAPACPQLGGERAFASSVSLRCSPRPFTDPSCGRLYAIDAAGGLLCAGGADGRVAVWSLSPAASEPEEDDTSEGNNSCMPLLLSWKAHGGWVSGVTLAGDISSEDEEGGCVLATTGNDGLLRVWRLSRAASAAPLSTPAMVASGPTHGGRGVFCSHGRLASRTAPDVLLWTAGKDGSTAACAVSPCGAIRVVERFAGGDGCGVATCVRARDASVAAGGCGAGVTRVLDARAPPSTSAARPQSLTLGAESRRGGASVCSLDWHPSAPHLVLVGHDDGATHVWDARSPSLPVHSFPCDHAGATKGGKRCQHRPVFVGGGAGVADARGAVLSLHDAEQYSAARAAPPPRRWALHEEATSAACGFGGAAAESSRGGSGDGNDNNVLFVARKGGVDAFRLAWGEGDEGDAA